MRLPPCAKLRYLQFLKGKKINLRLVKFCYVSQPRIKSIVSEGFTEYPVGNRLCRLSDVDKRSLNQPTVTIGSYPHVRKTSFFLRSKVTSLKLNSGFDLPITFQQDSI